MGENTDGTINETAESITKASVRGYVIDEQSMFIYAGIVDEDYTDRKNIRLNSNLRATRTGQSAYRAIMRKRLDSK